MIGLDTLSNQKNPQSGPLTHGVKAAVAGEAEWKPLEPPLSFDKNSEPKQYCVPAETAKISVTTRDWKPHPHSGHLCGVWNTLENILRERQWVIISLIRLRLQVQLLFPHVAVMLSKSTLSGT